MSIGFGSKNSTTTQEQQSKTDPWAPTQPYLTDFLKKLNTAGSSLGGGLNAGETAAFDTLKTNAAQGNQWAPQIGTLADDLFGTKSNSGQVQDAAKTLSSGLGDYASGKNLDLNNNPYIQQMLSTIRSDASNSINSQFAGAGRDLSGDHAVALGRGIAQGEAPVLANLFQDAQNKQIDAIKTIGSTNANAGVTAQALDKDALGTRATGVDAAQAALDAKNYGANAQLTLEEQIKKLPVDQLGWLAQYLFPAAGLGSQSQGTGTANSNSSQFGVGLKLL